MLIWAERIFPQCVWKCCCTVRYEHLFRTQKATIVSEKCVKADHSGKQHTARRIPAMLTEGVREWASADSHKCDFIMLWAFCMEGKLNMNNVTFCKINPGGVVKKSESDCMLSSS